MPAAGVEVLGAVIGSVERVGTWSTWSTWSTWARGHVEHMGRSTAAPESGTGIPGFRIAPVAAG